MSTAGFPLQLRNASDNHSSECCSKIDDIQAELLLWRGLFMHLCLGSGPPGGHVEHLFQFVQALFISVTHLRLLPEQKTTNFVLKFVLIIL